MRSSGWVRTMANSMEVKVCVFHIQTFETGLIQDTNKKYFFKQCVMRHCMRELYIACMHIAYTDFSTPV